MLRDLLVGVIEAEADVELVGEISEAESATEAVERCGASVVVLPADHPEMRGEPPLLAARARADLRLVALTPDGRQGCLYEMRPHRISLRELSPRSLLEVIRGSSRDG
jgi:chemotaxis response regulator CheB